MNKWFNYLGLINLAWYTCLRWTLLSGYAWLYNPINFLTAIASIIFLIPVTISCILNQENKLYNYWFMSFAFVITAGNGWYAIEDYLDWTSNHKYIQIVFILLDLSMFFYATTWFKIAAVFLKTFKKK